MELFVQMFANLRLQYLSIAISTLLFAIATGIPAFDAYSDSRVLDLRTCPTMSTIMSAYTTVFCNVSVMSCICWRSLSPAVTSTMEPARRDTFLNSVAARLRRFSQQYAEPESRSPYGDSLAGMYSESPSSPGSNLRPWESCPALPEGAHLKHSKSRDVIDHSKERNSLSSGRLNRILSPQEKGGARYLSRVLEGITVISNSVTFPHLERQQTRALSFELVQETASASRVSRATTSARIHD